MAKLQMRWIHIIGLIMLRQIKFVNPYRKVLFPIHIFQAHIKENELIKEELSHAIDNYRDKGDSKVPEGWLTDNLLTSYDADNFNFKLFTESQVTQRLYEKYILKFFDRPTKVNVLDMLSLIHI